jgi:membrane-bound lytic murein transglycosylase B
MKFTIPTWNPFAWVKQAPMTQDEMDCYDLNQDLEKTKRQLRDLELERIELEYKFHGIQAQLDYIHRANNPKSKSDEVHDLIRRMETFR